MSTRKTLVRELVERRELLFLFVYREIQVKYKQSVMGLLWAVFMPLLVVSAGVLVRYGYAYVANRPFDWSDLASVAVKSVPWAFVVASIRFSSTSLISNRNLVTKIYFPRAIFLCVCWEWASPVWTRPVCDKDSCSTKTSGSDNRAWMQREIRSESDLARPHCVERHPCHLRGSLGRVMRTRAGEGSGVTGDGPRRRPWYTEGNITDHVHSSHWHRRVAHS